MRYLYATERRNRQMKSELERMNNNNNKTLTSMAIKWTRCAFIHICTQFQVIRLERMWSGEIVSQNSILNPYKQIHIELVPNDVSMHHCFNAQMSTIFSRDVSMFFMRFFVVFFYLLRFRKFKCNCDSRLIWFSDI